MVSDTVIVEGGPAKGAPPTPTTLLARLDRLPDAPGVYLMKGRRGEILYIGKANVLADRGRSYFQKGADPVGPDVCLSHIEIGREHALTPVTSASRMPSSSFKKKK